LAAPCSFSPLRELAGGYGIRSWLVILISCSVSSVSRGQTKKELQNHLVGWLPDCPGTKQSGGKRLSGATRTGNTYVRAMLGEVAWIISRMKDNYLAAQSHRVARRRGREKAIVAVSHSLLVIIYHVLREKKPYTDLGADYFDKLDTARIERHHVRRLEQLGYTVTLTPAHAA
jgi:transposase